MKNGLFLYNVIFYQILKYLNTFLRSSLTYIFEVILEKQYFP